MPEIEKEPISTDEGAWQISVANEDGTRKFAEDFVKRLRPGDTVALFGDLGAGKTAFVRAMAAALGYKSFVNSPTFSILNIYPTAKFEIYHFDFYRLAVAEEALDIGFDEYLQNEGFCFIEWPEKIAEYLPMRYWEIHLELPDYLQRPAARTIRMRRVEK